MGFVKSLFSNSQGAGFKGSGSDIREVTGLNDIKDANDQYNYGMGQQQSFLQALNAQNGAANQSNVFNQQQALANQMQGVADGTGPNPALAQLNNTTGQNVANQAALMAGQRGTGANAGLLARQAAMQGGALQQQAVGQGAALQAQQQLNAMSALSGQQAQMGGLANQQIANQQAAIGQYGQMNQNRQNALLGSVANENSARAGMQSNINNANASIAQGNQQLQAKALGGFFDAASGANAPMGGGGSGGGGGGGSGMASMGALMLANKGGTVPGYADGGMAGFLDDTSTGENILGAADQANAIDPGMQQNLITQNSPMNSSIPQSKVGQTLNGKQSPSDKRWDLGPRTQLQDPGIPQAQMLPQAPLAINRSAGGKVPGKAIVKGDSIDNDIVPAKLSPGEIVIPRTVLQQKDPVTAAARFVQAELRKHGAGGKKNLYSGGEAGEGPGSDDATAAAAADEPGASVPPNVQFMQAQQAANDERETNQKLDEQPEDVVAAAQPTAPAAGGEVSLASLGSGKIGTLPTSGDPGQMQKGINQMMSGIQGASEAERGLAREQAKIETQNIADLQKQKIDYQSHYDALEKERVAVQNDYINGHVDPNRFVNNLSTGQKIRTVIGLMLGGMGGAINGHENYAQKFLNQQIDNDINAQKTDLGKKENLLSANLKQFGNLQQATEMTKVMQLSLVEANLKKAMAESNDPLVKSRAQQQIGALNIQIAPMMQQLALKKMAMSGAQGAGADPSKLVPLLVPKEHQTKVFKEIEDAQNAARNRDAYLQHWDQAAKDVQFTKSGRPLYATVLTPPSLKAMAPLEDALIHDEVGRVNEFEKKDVGDNHPKAWDDKATLAIKRKAIEQFFDRKSAAPTASSFGINVNQGIQKAPEVKTMGGVKYQKVNGGWKRI